jgi:hypothetical protein
LLEKREQFCGLAGLQECCFDAVEQLACLPVLRVQFIKEQLVVAERFVGASKFAFEVGCSEAGLGSAIGVCE